ncbi:MAG: hypothetical protein J0H15_09785 [Xanthomonadales bacterium]|nr:hypothetical protein [Xanthomonadales bacterium]
MTLAEPADIVRVALPRSIAAQLERRPSGHVCDLLALFAVLHTWVATQTAGEEVVSPDS